MSRESNVVPYPLAEFAQQAETVAAVQELEASFAAAETDLSRHQRASRFAAGPELNAAERAAVVGLDRLWPTPPARLWRRWQRLLVPLGVAAPSEQPGPVDLRQLLLLAAAASPHTSAAWALTRSESVEEAVALRFAIAYLHPVLRARSAAMLGEEALPWDWRAARERERLAEACEVPPCATWVEELRGRLVAVVTGPEPVPTSLERWLFEDLPLETPPAERWRYLRMDQLVADEEPLLTALLSPTDWMVEAELMAAAALRESNLMEWLAHLGRIPREGQQPRLYELLDAGNDEPVVRHDSVSLRPVFGAAAQVWAALDTLSLLTTTLEACEGSVPWDLLLALSLRPDLREAVETALPALDDYEVDVRAWVAALRWAGRELPAQLTACAEAASELSLGALLASATTPAASPLMERLRSPLSSYAVGLHRDIATAYGSAPSPNAPSSQPSMTFTSSDES